MTIPVFGAAALFAAIALCSLFWGIEHDTTAMAYAGFLMGHLHWVPYRDLFDPNLPGTYLFYTVLDRLFGPHDFGFRCVDVLLMAALSVVTWKWLRPFGWMPALLGPALFGLYYLHDGPMLCLQREFLMLPLFSLAVLFATDLDGLGSHVRALGIGASVGLATLIKPQAVLILPSLIAFVLIEDAASAGDSIPSARLGRWVRTTLLCVAGAAAPVLAAVGWLAAAGALGEYVSMARNYYPLYSHLNGIHQTMDEAGRRQYVMDGLRLVGGLRPWLIPAALGAFIAAWPRSAPGSLRRRAALLVALAVTTYFFPAISGQFFPYHWLPFFFFAAALASLCLTRPAPGIPAPVRALAAVLLVWVAVTHVQFAPELERQLTGAPYKHHFSGRSDVIAEYLRTHLKPGDTVQPLDWTGGSVEAMWRARAPLATRFMADFYFYHHVSTPYIQSLRRRFMAELRRAKPRVVIDIRTAKPWVSGEDTTQEFPELTSYLEANYTVDFVGAGYYIHLRR
jgi:hypothetical protein